VLVGGGVAVAAALHATKRSAPSSIKHMGRNLQVWCFMAGTPHQQKYVERWEIDYICVASFTTALSKSAETI
jgi:hypothetical protein